MRCPACGSDEVDREFCSQCHTALMESDDSYDFEEKEVSPPPAVKPPATPPAPTSKKSPPPSPKEGKHRPRPLHDLDLTLPELDVQPPPKIKSRLEKPSSRPSEKGSSPVARTGHAGSPPPAKQRKPSPPSRPQPPSDRKIPDGESSLDFSSYILSIGTAALMALGGAKMPGMPSAPGSGPKDIAQGKELLDLLAMLYKKTEGNLTISEAELLKQTLHNLRAKMAQAIKGS